MCSEIDARTRENPEAAMGHHNQLLTHACHQQGMGDIWLYTQQFQQQIAEGREARVKPPIMNGDPSKFSSGQTGDSWPWPKSPPEPKPDAPHFDEEAHAKFMRSLG